MGKRTILLVEDIEFNRDLVVQILEENYEILQAVDGLEGVRLAVEGRPDLILMDLSLPGIDGWEATRRIRQQPHLAKVPIIALTAHAMASDRLRALEAGCNDVLTKPIDDDALLLKVASEIQKAGPSRPSGHPAKDVAAAVDFSSVRLTPEQGNVLILDGDSDWHLPDLGPYAPTWSVRTAKLSEDFANTSSTDEPHVILVNLTSVGRQGLELCTQARRHYAYAAIIVCGPVSLSITDAQVFGAGADDRITWPCDLSELSARLAAALRMKRTRDDLRHGTPRPRLHGTPSPRVWDEHYLLERIAEEERRLADGNESLAAVAFAFHEAHSLLQNKGSASFAALMSDFATLLLNYRRPSDVFSKYGVDQFMSLLPGADATDAAALASRMRAAVQAKTFNLGGESLKLSVSAGVAAFRPGFLHAVERAVRGADAALCLARRGTDSLVLVLDR